ncbi:MgtC/SapB family protein [Flaviaesturariibacter aridisoli]|uniref:MgtC/SapB family protein n=1 Tax=Flaviaesturariibacter aridisoli TaxID=2545761 RepID=A0A4R4E0H4_9BACT|nr:MgtC/SapB family protein [Flaviaesturariibacter aridisoli]TCZ72914.1 MgtC/SapB family protein [Flaviaesturariibacter aridisoli]
MLTWPQLIGQLLMVVLVGGLIGAEREFRSKSAGFRTMILICLGSWIFTTLSMTISHSSDDRIASNIVTGIGFLGAGVIFKADNRINGITTAATIWATAALGMGIADGAYKLVLLATLLVLAVLWLLTRLETYIDRVNQSHTYRVVSDYREDLLKEYEQLFDDCHLRYKRLKRTRRGDSIIGTWYAQGSEKNHNRFTRLLMHHPSVREFEF